MKCPDCGRELIANMFSVGKIEPMIAGTGRTLESRDESYFCTECGTNITAALTITRVPRSSSRSPQVIDQAVSKEPVMNLKQPQAALPGDQPRLN